MHTVLLDCSFLFLYIHTMSIQIIFILTSYFLTLYLFPLCHLLTPYYLHLIIPTTFAPLQCWRGSTQPRHSSGAEEEIQSYRRYVRTACTGSMYSRVQCTCIWIYSTCVHILIHRCKHTRTHTCIYTKKHAYMQTDTLTVHTHTHHVRTTHTTHFDNFHITENTKISKSSGQLNSNK